MDTFSVVIAALSALATVFAAWAAGGSARASKKIVDLTELHENNRIRLLKNHHEVEHLKNLIGAFAEIRALAAAQWSDSRNAKLEEAIRAMNFHVSVLESLGTDTSKMVRDWRTARAEDGESIPRAVDYVLGMNAIVGSRSLAFLESKMQSLHSIQERLFASMTQPAEQDQ